MQQIESTIAQCIASAEQLLTPVSDSAKLDAQILLAFTLQKEPSYLLTWPEKRLAAEEAEQFEKLLQRRVVGEPIAYIVGIKEFWSLPLKVSPATLIPRPDTEVLVELVLELFGENSSQYCLDLGTGTGAIALALASEQDDWQIDAVDFKHEAVSLAKGNAKKLQLDHVNIFQSDWFSAVETKTYDFIVSNPPYIDELDENLSQGDVRFEPKSALVANEQGLADIKHIAEHAKNYLNTDGALFFEHGFEQAAQVKDIFEQLGYKSAQTKQDYNGHDRVTWAYLTK